MSDQEMSYNLDQLNQSAGQILEAHGRATDHLQNFQSQASAYKQWWNPDNDANDLIGSTFGAVYGPTYQLAISNTQQNLDALYSYGKAAQDMAANTQSAEDASIQATSSVGYGE